MSESLSAQAHPVVSGAYGPHAAPDFGKRISAMWTLVLQLLDARIPRSSLNPETAKRLRQGKPHLYLLNKADLADEAVTARWSGVFSRPRRRRRALHVYQQTAHRHAGRKSCYLEPELGRSFWKNVPSARHGRCAASRVMVVGIPNVGKSTFHQQLYGQRRARRRQTSPALRAASSG